MSMPSPGVDTFEHDIADELIQKDASLTSIATAVGDIGNAPPEKSNLSLILVIVAAIIFCVVAGLGYVGYLYSNGEIFSTPAAPAPPVTRQKKPQTLQVLSKTLDTEVGDYVSSVQKNKGGYTIMLSSYPQVYSYVTRNEADYINEIGMSLKEAYGSDATSTVLDKKIVVATSTPTVNATATLPIVSSTTVVSTLLATSTATTSKSTKIKKISPTKPASSTPLVVATTTEEESAPVIDIPLANLQYNDTTIDGLTMRIWKTQSGPVVYAFIDTIALVFSTTTDGIIELRNDILHK